MRTLGLARRHGGGVVLTDGKERFRVSDWSDATKDVYGHIWANGDWSQYQRLNPNLDMYVDPVALYEKSAHRATEGSPAEKAILKELTEGDPAVFGETSDPVLRARRRLQGSDGLRDDIYDMMAPFQMRKSHIADEARHIAAKMIRVRLQRLEDVLPRHRFTMISAHLIVFKLEVSPPIRCFTSHPCDSIDTLVDKKGWLRNPDAPFQDLGAWIYEQSEEMSQIAVKFSDEFNFDIGWVTSNEASDIANDYGFNPKRIQDHEENMEEA